MIVSKVGIKTQSDEERRYFIENHGIAERKEGIEGIGGRMLFSSRKCESTREHFDEGIKINLCRNENIMKGVFVAAC